MKRVALFGSTGSIGRNVLDVVQRNRNRFQVVLLSCRSNAPLLREQARQFDAGAVHVMDAASQVVLRDSLPSSTKVLAGEETIEEAVIETKADLVVNAIVGAAGLAVSYHTLRAGKTLALANKESLVAGGELLRVVKERSGAKIIPIDSEHSALFQCLHAGKRSEVEKIILTASGGPFRSLPKEAFASIRVEDALKHPVWSMGKKITIDSATMMNKCLEVIEAHYLFDLSPRQIEVVIHPESIIHSMVQFVDGSVVAQMSPPDMRFPIAYALEYPERLPTDLPRLDFTRLDGLTFDAPDFERFPSILLAYKALEGGGLLPLILNAANEVAVKAFLDRRIKFSEIPVVVEMMMAQNVNVGEFSLRALLEADATVRQTTSELIGKGTFKQQNR